MLGYKLLPVIVVFNGIVPMDLADIHAIYTFGKDCSVSDSVLNEDVAVLIIYNGEDELWSGCNKMSFIGRDDYLVTLHEYKVCITPVIYKDPDCAVKMTYRHDYSGLKAEHTFDCYNKPVEKYCGDKNDYFYVEMTENGKSRGLVHIEMKVEAIKVSDYYQRVGIIVGSVIGGIALLCCCCYYCYQKCRETKPSTSTPGQVVTFNSAAEPLNQTPGPSVNPRTYYSPQQGDYPSNQNQTNYIYPTPYSPRADHEASAPSMSDYGQPPPSYESVTIMQ